MDSIRVPLSPDLVQVIMSLNSPVTWLTLSLALSCSLFLFLSLSLSLSLSLTLSFNRLMSSSYPFFLMSCFLPAMNPFVISHSPFLCLHTDFFYLFHACNPPLYHLMLFILSVVYHSDSRGACLLSRDGSHAQVVTDMFLSVCLSVCLYIQGPYIPRSR